MDVTDWIKKCEGLKLHLYKDSVSKFTIGYGRNIEDNGISQDEAELMFKNDFMRTTRELMEHDWYYTQPLAVQQALINMNFNLGITKMLGFKKMIAALKQKDYRTAANEAMNSVWAKQVGDRARDIALIIREADASTAGTDSTD